MEIEAKFTLPDSATLQEIASITDLDGLTISSGTVSKLHDVYLDTPDRDLLAAGWVCRRRESNSGLLITVKQLVSSDGAIHRREELQAELLSDQPPSNWPSGPARDLVVRIAGDKALSPLLDLSQTRQSRMVVRDGVPIAELSLDEVEVAAGPRALHFLELEVELISPGTEQDLQAVVQHLQSRWRISPESRSKFERALQFTTGASEPAGAQVDQERSSSPALATEPGIGIEDSMSEAARKTLLFHFQRMLEHENGTRSGEDAEELHDMRVATRRMRAALQVFSDHLDPEALRPFARALRRTGRALGAVRDLDVFREKAQRYIDSLRPSRSGDLEPLLAAWRIEYDQRRAEMLAHLDGREYARFKQAFGEFLNQPGAGAVPILSPKDEPIPHCVRHVVPGVLFASYGQVRAFDEWLVGPNVSLARYHQLRISSKRLRYTLEFFQEVLGAGAKPLIERVKRLQDHLGNLQDAVVSSGILSSYLMWGTWKHEEPSHASGQPVVDPGVAAYLAAHQFEYRRLIRELPPSLAKDQRKSVQPATGAVGGKPVA